MLTEKENIFEKVTDEDIDQEIERLVSLFKQIPYDTVTGFKARSAERLIAQVINYAALNHYEALGILEEAKLQYREISLEIMDEEVKEEVLIQNAQDTACEYRCIKEIQFEDSSKIGVVDKIYKIGYVEENENYSGGVRYEVFQEDGSHFSICLGVLDAHFQLENE